MLRPLVFQPATRFSLQQLAAFFTAAYEDYPYPVALNAGQLARRVREESLDLAASAVAESGGQPAGLFLLGRRGRESWCGGFGVNKALRGRGLSAPLAAEMIARARAAGATSLQLEVLFNNRVARTAYERAGFRSVRELLILGWSPAIPPAAPAGPAPELAPLGVAEHLAAWRTAPALRMAWQRTPESLPLRTEAEVWRSGTASAAVAPLPDGSARIVSLHLPAAADAAVLLAGLQRRFRRLMVINEPAESPHLPALAAAGFKETDRQHEMRLDLVPA